MSGGTTFSPRAQASTASTMSSRSSLLGDEPRRARLERLVDDAAVGERRHEQDACRQLLADDGVRDSHAVELRQLVVEQRDIGQMLLDRGQS